MNPDIKDIKAPLDLPDPWIWLWIILAALAVIALMAWVIIWFLKKPKQLETKKDLSIIPPWQKAYDRLENLRLKKIMERTFLKPFYIELSDIIRHYLEEQFSIKAPEMTTEEFLDSLKNSPALTEAQQEILKEFLGICDMVKFAKHPSSVSEAQKSFDLVKSLIDQTHGT